ncbi:hypothetical protein D3C76_1422290 [compost metagenome]
MFRRVFADDISVVSEGVLVNVGEPHAPLERGFEYVQEYDLGLRGNRLREFDGPKR